MTTNEDLDQARTRARNGESTDADHRQLAEAGEIEWLDDGDAPAGWAWTTR